MKVLYLPQALNINLIRIDIIVIPYYHCSYMQEIAGMIIGSLIN